MKISIYSMKIYENNGSVKASASITIDDSIAVNGIILKTDDSGNYKLFFPRLQGERYEIVHPVSIEARNQILSKILAAYQSETRKIIHGGNTHESNRSDQH